MNHFYYVLICNESANSYINYYQQDADKLNALKDIFISEAENSPIKIRSSSNIVVYHTIVSLGCDHFFFGNQSETETGFSFYLR